MTERPIRELEAKLRHLLDEAEAGRPVEDELAAVTAELADELDRYNEIGDPRADESPRAASGAEYS